MMNHPGTSGADRWNNSKTDLKMKYGHFDDAAREYVITQHKTPWPWINYLGNKDFFSIISNTAGGYSFYRDARLRRITRCAGLGVQRLVAEDRGGNRDG